MKDILFGKTLSELKGVVKELGLPGFTAKQIADWLYCKGVSSVDEMSNLSKKARQLLSEKFEFGLVEPSNVQESVDGTKKYLFPTGDKFIESAYIPDRERATLCVSSQVGCKMGCLFCMTARQGFQKQLTSGEIINQIRSLPERDKLTNIVYMGMGEPFDNLGNVMKSLEILTADYGFAMSPKRITVSTIGIVPAMKVFLEECKCHLAVSLHTPFDEERQQLMPVQTVHSARKVIELIKQYDFTGQRRVTFEYILFEGVNDSSRHVNELAKLLDGLKCRVNLIAFHSIPDSSLRGSDAATMEVFKDKLNRKGIVATIRRSRGEDIFAACGLLSTKALQDNSNS